MSALVSLYFRAKVQKVEADGDLYWLPSVNEYRVDSAASLDSAIDQVIEVEAAHVHEHKDVTKQLGPFCFPCEELCSPVPAATATEVSPRLFVLTEANGSRFYGASLCFFTDEPTEAVAVPQAIGLLSRYPFYWNHIRILQTCFIQLRDHGFDQKLVDLLSSADVQRPGTVEVEFRVGSQAIAPTERLLPWINEYSFADASLHCFFQNVTEGQAVEIVGHALLEGKVLFIGNDTCVLLAVTHALLTLLFPFAWRHPYVPNVPDIMTDVLQCPTPCIFGILDSVIDGEESGVENEGMLVVRMTEDGALLTGDFFSNCLPRKAKNQLVDRLRRFMRTSTQPMNTLSRMFSSEPLVEACEEGAFSEGLRALFARFYCDLLQGGDQTKVGSSLFNIESFMASQDSSGSREFWRRFSETDLFLSFIEDRQQMDGDMFALASFDIDYLEYGASGKRSSLRRILRAPQEELNDFKVIRNELIQQLPFDAMELRVDFIEISPEKVPRSPSSQAIFQAHEDRKKAYTLLCDDISHFESEIARLTAELSVAKRALEERERALRRMEQKDATISSGK